MNKIEFVSFGSVEPVDMLAVLNQDELRKHLVDHDYFDAESIQAWMKQKLEIETQAGCRVRVVIIDGALAGWCGIQPDGNNFEIAIVISKRFWGSGISIFKTLMRWARELGHHEIVFHLLDSRPEYKALTKIATKVQSTQLLGRCFTTYYVPVGN